MLHSLGGASFGTENRDHFSARCAKGRAIRSRIRDRVLLQPIRLFNSLEQ